MQNWPFHIRLGVQTYQRKHTLSIAQTWAGDVMRVYKVCSIGTPTLDQIMRVRSMPEIDSIRTGTRTTLTRVWMHHARMSKQVADRHGPQLAGLELRCLV